MASWFYLYLYTEEKPISKDLITAIVSKTTFIQKCNSMSSIRGYDNINIDEGTSHWIDSTVKNIDGTDMDLTYCSAVFTAGDIEKECMIENNHIKVKLELEEIVCYLSNAYQISVFDSEGDVFKIIQGFIYIRKAHKHYITNPLGGE